MPSVIWAEICRRMLRRRVFVKIGLATLGALLWVGVGMVTYPSTIAEMLLPGVILPGVTGALFLGAGMSWIMLGPSPGHLIHCGKCGYDLRNLAANDPTCPECGSDGVATTEPRAIVRLFIRLPGMVLLLAGMFFVGVSVLVLALINDGALE